MPGWQALHAELEPRGLTVVTVALDLDPSKTTEWIAAASPTHPSILDPHHLVDQHLGINNVPMAVWIDETGTLVRPPESASIEPSPLRDMEITDDLPERMRMMLTEVKKIPDMAEDYRAAIVDWVEHGAESRFALAPHEVIAASLPRPREHSRAAALFELGCHLHDTVGKDAAVPYWKQAHAAHPENWTYKRQAWTLESTPPGEASDMTQEVSDTYGTTWLDDVVALGGGDTYGIRPAL